MSSLRAKILLGYGLALLLVAMVMGWALLNLLRLGQAATSILSENYRSILAAENMAAAIQRQDRAILASLAGSPRAAEVQFTESETQFLQWLGRARDNITIEGEAQVVDSIAQGYEGFLLRCGELDRLQSSSVARAAQYYDSAVLPAFSTVIQAAEHLHELNQQTMFHAGDRAEKIAAWAALSTAGVGGAAIAVGLVFSLVLSSRVTRPVRLMSAATGRIAEGSYDVRIGISSKDELGRLAEGFDSMVARLESYNRLNIGKIVEEKLKNDALIRSIEDGIILLDDHLQVSNMNPAAERIFGLRFDPSVPRRLPEIVAEPQLLAQVEEAAQNGARLSVEGDAPTVSLERGGATRCYQFFLTPVLSPERKRLGTVLVLRDITRLMEIEKLKDEFMMSAAHELKTPLTGIAMSIGLLRERYAGGVDERTGELLGVAEAEVGRLRALVSDLLDLSRVESGSIALQIEPVPAETLVEKACALFRAQAAEKSVHLGWVVEEQTDGIRVDATKIGWVLTNLLSNALRYTGPEGHVKLRARRAGGFVYFSVTDDGAGIPPEHQSRIFDKFAHLNAGGHQGGLGLAICREIVRAHGGTIWVESEVGKGSVFTFTVPVERKRQ